MISLKGLDKAEVLCALHRRSHPQGMGHFHPQADEELTIEGARILLKRQTYFDYLAGRVMKIDLSGAELDPRLYDRDLGQGAAERTIDALRRKTNAD